MPERRGALLRGALAFRDASTRLPRAAWAGTSAAWMALIWIASSFGQEDSGWMNRVPSFWLNFGHAVIFGALALWLCFTLPRRAGHRARRAPTVTPGGAFAVLAVAVGFGLVDEWHQSWVPGRHPTFLDVLTDAVGAACTVWVVAYAGAERAREGGFALRVALSLALSVASAWGATAFHTLHPEPLWF